MTGAAEDVRLKTLGGGKAQQQGPRPLGDLRVRIALAPVTGLWSRLTAAQRAIALRAADQALHVLSGIVGPEAAPQVLAHRLADRLQETGGEALVREPMGWLLGRGLVQRPACPDPRCDDSIRLDTGTDCPSCANIAHIRRMLRTRIAAQVGSQMPCSDPATCRAETERRLREETALEEQRAQIRRTHAEREIEQRQQALARRRALEQEAELVRRQAPCVDCGLPEAAGLCPACSSRRRTEELVERGGRPGRRGPGRPVGRDRSHRAHSPVRKRHPRSAGGGVRAGLRAGRRPGPRRVHRAEGGAADPGRATSGGATPAAEVGSGDGGERRRARCMPAAPRPRSGGCRAGRGHGGPPYRGVLARPTLGRAWCCSPEHS
ncbi:hypothetical protein SGRIM128S_07559 [Streptomyces griseomycini]